MTNKLPKVGKYYQKYGDYWVKRARGEIWKFIDDSENDDETGMLFCIEGWSAGVREYHDLSNFFEKWKEVKINFEELPSETKEEPKLALPKI